MICKLICSDIDGTLLDVKRQLSTKTINAIKGIDESIPFVLISSRMPKSIRLLQNELNRHNSPFIAYNGALIFDKRGKIIESVEIPFSITYQICNLLPHNSIHFSLYHNDQWFVSSKDYWAEREENNTRVSPKVRSLSETLFSWEKSQKGAHKIMVMGEPLKLNKIESFINNKFKYQVNSYRSKDTYLEISNKKIDKAFALEHLLSKVYPNINMIDVVAFGDNYNDQTMLENVGMGIAVENAKQEILDCTSFHTLNSHRDGVAVAINKINK